jgi:diguanylate cyclase (GGDEF)-like protein
MELRHFLERRMTRLPLIPGRAYSVGRSPDRDFALSDPTVSRNHAGLSWDHDSFLVTDNGSTNGTFLNGERIRTARLSSGDTLRFGRVEAVYTVKSVDGDAQEEALSPTDTVILESKLQNLVGDMGDPKLEERVGEILQLMRSKKRDLADLAYRDGLTGLYNRRYFDEAIASEWKRLSRYKRPLSLIIADIDHFKKVNDAYGHQKGDSVLRAIAGIIRENLRSSDLPCRYGGEEMAVILPETAIAEAMRTAEKLRSLVEAQVPEMEGFPVTASFGVGSWGSALASPGDLVAAADAALYEAKRAGRNRVMRALTSSERRGGA